MIHGLPRVLREMSLAWLLLLTVLVGGASEARSDEGSGPLAKLAADAELARLMLSSPPTQELTSRLLALTYTARRKTITAAFRRALGDVQMFRVVEHILASEELHRGDLLAIRSELECSWLVDARLVSLRRLDADLCAFGLVEGRSVLCMRATPDVPGDVLTVHGTCRDAERLEGQTSRWVFRLTERPVNGCVLLRPGGVWRSGSGESVLRAMRRCGPFSATNPDVLLYILRTGSDEQRWLAALQVLCSCRNLGGQWTDWWLESNWFEQQRVLALVDRIERSLEAVRERIQWLECDRAFGWK